MKLSEEARGLLKALQEHLGLSMAAIIEWAIRALARDQKIHLKEKNGQEED